MTLIIVFIYLILTSFTLNPCPAALTTTITIPRYSVTIPSDSTSHAAVLKTIRSIKPYWTLWEEKNTVLCNMKHNGTFVVSSLLVLAKTPTKYLRNETIVIYWTFWKSFGTIEKKILNIDNKVETFFICIFVEYRCLP